MIRPIELIGYACGLGAKKRSCQQGPGKLMYGHLERHLRTAGINAQWAPLALTEPETELPLLSSLTHYLEHLKHQIESAHSRQYFPVCIGGDHSMAIATWSTIATLYQATQCFGLIWIDAHMDSHTPETSHTGAYHGMPLSYLLGAGDSHFSSLVGHRSVIKPEHLVLIGVRSYESEEHQFLQKLGVRIFYMEDILTRGMQNVLNDALAIVKKDTAGFGISVDLDAFDPQVAPGVGSPVIGGLDKELTLAALRQIGHDPLLKGFEIAEFNPSLDYENQTADLISDLLFNCFRKDS